MGAPSSSKNKRDARPDPDSARHTRPAPPPSKEISKEKERDKAGEKDRKSEKIEKLDKLDKLDKKREPEKLPPAPRSAADLPVVEEAQDVASMSDEDLMKLCQEGDEAAFSVLFQRYETQALSFIHRLIGDQSRTEALGQEAFLRIFKDAKSYQYPRSFTTWFYTIVRNLCKNELRWRSRHPTVSIEENIGHSEHSGSDRASRIGDMLRSDSTDPLESMVLRERNGKLERAMDALPELERDILILNRFQGLKYREISEIVGVPIGTVRVRIYSALETLRKAIKEYL